MSEVHTDSTIVIEGPFETEREHVVQLDFLQRHIESFEAAASVVSQSVITDSYVRERYRLHIKRISNAVELAVKNGELSAIDGAKYCSQMRDKLFVEYRKYTSAIGNAKAESLKLKARGFDFYLNKYSNVRYEVYFRYLNAAQRAEVYLDTVISAGRDDKETTKATKRLKGYGITATLVIAIYAVSQIIKAKDKIREAASQGDIIAAGFIGGAIAGGAVSFICGPAEPLCATVTVAVGAAIGGELGSHIQDGYESALASFKDIIAN